MYLGISPPRRYNTMKRQLQSMSARYLTIATYLTIARYKPQNVSYSLEYFSGVLPTTECQLATIKNARLSYLKM